MLKVAIVGCGKIAEAHAAWIQRIGGAEIVAACDREPLMAQQLCERFSIRRSFTDVEDLLAASKPDAVHVTTPPASHFDVAKICLERGCHVYVEKPFTLTYAESQRLIALAHDTRLTVTVGHDDQFSHVARRMRALVRAGYVGPRPIHMESYYGYNLAGDAYARAVLDDSRHWVRRLPGKLLHNLISHGIARIAEFLAGTSPRVMAHGFVSPWLKETGEDDLIDELRVIIADDRQSTAYFTFSSQMRPPLHQFRLYGEKGGLILDQDQETLLRVRGDRFKSYAEKFVPPVLFAGQYLDNLSHNVGRFVARDFHMKSGMGHLIAAFYRSIRENAAPPIPYREILLTVRIMETIFQQLASSHPGAQSAHIDDYCAATAATGTVG